MHRKSIIKLSGQMTTGVRVLRLYVAGSAPASRIEEICRQYLQGNYQLEIVDVLKQPRSAPWLMA